MYKCKVSVNFMMALTSFLQENVAALVQNTKSFTTTTLAITVLDEAYAEQKKHLTQTPKGFEFCGVSFFFNPDEAALATKKAVCSENKVIHSM